MNIQKIKIEIKNIFSAFFFLWMKKVLSAITILAILFSNLVIPSFNIVYASPLQDNNDGTWQDSYTDELGISDQSNVITSEGSVSLSACDGSISNGSFTTTPITPRSFSSWKKLEIDGIFGNSTLPSIDILDKDGSIIVSHNDVNSIIDISGIEAYLYPTIKVRINFNYSSSEACPSITNMKITFEPESVVITDISAPESIDAGNNLVYRLRNSVNYVSAKGLVIFAELPQLSGSENNVVLPDGYTSSPNPTFVSATQGGEYTASEISINGQTIPANSVYWNLGDTSEGWTSAFSFTIKAPIGTPNQTKYTLSSKSLSSTSSATETNEIETIIYSSPLANITKNSGSNVYIIGGTSQAQIGSTIEYKITAGNSGNGIMENVVMYDDVSNLCNSLDIDCTSGSDFSDISGGGVFQTNYTIPYGSNSGTTIPAIVWYGGNNLELKPNEQKTESFKVALKTDEKINNLKNTSCISGSNSGEKCDDFILQVGIDETVNGNIFRKDVSKSTLGFREQFSYYLRADNNTAITINDVLVIDRIPDDITFVGASLPTSANGQIFYSTSTGFTTDTTPPDFDYKNVSNATQDDGSLNTATNDLDVSGNDYWQNYKTNPPSDPSQVSWIAFFAPEIDSKIIPDSDSDITSIAGNILVKAPEGDKSMCDGIAIQNTGLFYVFNKQPIGGDDDARISSGIAQATHQRAVEIVSKKPILSISSTLDPTAINAPVLGESSKTVEYNITITNSNTTLSDTALDTTVDISWDQININGVNKYLPFLDITGEGIKEINNSDIENGNLQVNIGNLFPGQSKKLTLKLSVPVGVLDNTSYTIRAEAQTKDDLCPVSSVNTKATGTIQSLAKIKVYKNDVIDWVKPGSQLSYRLMYTNIGATPTTDTYVIDNIPDEIVLISVETVNNEKVLCSTSAELPQDISAREPLDKSDITNYFTHALIISSDNGTNTWECISKEATKWIAIKVDQEEIDGNPISPAVFPVGGGIKSVILNVRNDETKDNPNTIQTDSPEGTQVFNDVGIFSNELIQSIGNQVNSIITETPAIEVEKTGPEVVEAGSIFDWEIVYYNNSTSEDIIAMITDNLPKGVKYISATHEWNQEAIDNGAPNPLSSNLDAGESIPSEVVENTDGTTTVKFDIAQDYRNDNLKTLEGGKIIIKVQADPDLTTGTILFNEACGYAESDKGSFNICAEHFVEISNTELRLTKLADNPTPASGESYNYTLTFSNENKLDAQNVEIIDILPYGVNYKTGSTSLSPTDYTIGEPTISTTTNGSGQTVQMLTWSDIQKTGEDSQVINGKSGNIYLRYGVIIGDTVNPGTTLSNTAEITTTTNEDGTYPNTDSETVRTPYPDPAVIKTGQGKALPGSIITWKISYLNNNNEDATGVYLIDTLPDEDNSGNADVILKSISNDNGEIIYYSSNSSQTSVSFDPANPTANGWTTDMSSITNDPAKSVNHIAILLGKEPNNGLLRNSGPYILYLTADLRDPITGIEPPAGTDFTNNVEIFSATTDDDESNNSDDDTIQTPAFDISLTKTGNNQGTFPGVTPDSNIIYTLGIKNEGTTNAYGIRIQDTLSPYSELLDPADNFTSLDLRDEAGNTCNMLDPEGNKITENIPITRNIEDIQVQVQENNQTITKSTKEITWYIGNTDESSDLHYRDLALPPECEVYFEIYVKTKTDTPDTTLVSNTATIYSDRHSDDDPLEEYLENNTDDSSVVVYLSDVITEKTVVDDETGSSSETNAGSTLTYTIAYNNIGKITAEDIIISEIIPEGTSYVDGSLTAPQGSLVKFYDNRFDVEFPKLYAPSTWWSQSTVGEWIGNQSTGIKSFNLFEGEEKFNDFGAKSSSTVVKIDINNDGFQDIIIGNDGQSNELYINNGNGTFQSGVLVFNDFGNRSTKSVIVADINNDGFIDVIIGNYNQPNELYINNGDGTFQGKEMFNDFGNRPTSSVISADINNDGYKDIVIGNRSQPNELYINNGDGTFKSGIHAFNQFGSNVDTLSMLEVDINNDGFQDIFIGTTSYNELYINNKNGTFQGFRNNNIAGGITWALAKMDINNDGFQDIIYGSSWNNEVLLNNNGNGTFIRKSMFNDFGNRDTRSIMPIDINNDGYEDIVIGNRSQPKELYINNGDGTFQGKEMFNDFGNSYTYSMIDIDLNGDNYKDIIIANYGVNELYINKGPEKTCSILTYTPEEKWVKTMGGTNYDYGNSVSVDNEGNVYTTGYFSSTVDFGLGNVVSKGNFDIFITKHDSAGNILWVKTIGGMNYDIGKSISVDNDGNVYTTGYFQGTVNFGLGNVVSKGTQDIFITKHDTDGNILWVKTIGGTRGNYGYSVSVDNEGNIYTTGYFSSTVDFGLGNLVSKGRNDIFITKHDSAGNILWVKTMGGTNDDYGNSVSVDNEGNVYTTGYFSYTVDFGLGNVVSKGINDIFITKHDSAGNILWVKTMGGTGTDYGNSVSVDNDGNVYTTGYFSNTVDLGLGNVTSKGGTDIFITKHDTDGNIVWVKTFGGTSFDFGHSVSVDNGGNIYTTGRFNGTVDFGLGNVTSKGGTDIFITKHDTDGNIVWVKTMGGTSNDVGNSVSVDNEGNIYTTGDFQGTADFGLGNVASKGNYDIFITKHDSNGNLATAVPGYYSPTGSTTSPQISPTLLYPTSGSLISWKDLIIDQTKPEGTEVRYDVLDAKDNTPISGFTGLIPDERGMISLAGLSATTYPAIKLKANLSTTLADSTPGVCQWTTTFEMEKSPSFTFKVKIDDRPEVSEINNTVDISTSTAETNYLNNSSEAQIQIIMSDVEVEKSVDKTAVFTSETLTYTLDYINNGPRDARNVSLIDTLPSDLTFGSFVSGHLADESNCSQNSGVITCNIGDLAVGSTGSIVFTATVSATASGGKSITNTTEISTSTAETDYTNNSDSVSSVVGSFTNLWIDKSTTHNSASIGDTISYTLIYGNNGNTQANNVVIEDIMPEGCELISSIPEYSSSTGTTLSWNLDDIDGDAGTGSLAVGETGKIDIVCEIKSDASLVGTILGNTATIDTPTPETTKADNVSSVGTVIGISTSSISGFIWNDSDGDNSREYGKSYNGYSEKGIAGVQVRLTGTDIFGDPVSEMTTTDNNGAYQFVGIMPSSVNGYTITECPDGCSVLDNYKHLSSVIGVGTSGFEGATNNDILPIPEYGEFINIILDAGDRATEYNFAKIQKKEMRIGDRVWFDTNKNGIQDSGERGIPNIGVKLFDSDGMQIDSTTTDDKGNYSFMVYKEGRYYILADRGESYLVTKYKQTDENIDSDADYKGDTGYIRVDYINSIYNDLDIGFFDKPISRSSGGGGGGGGIIIPKCTIEKLVCKTVGDLGTTYKYYRIDGLSNYSCSGGLLGSVCTPETSEDIKDLENEEEELELNSAPPAPISETENTTNDTNETNPVSQTNNISYNSWIKNLTQEDKEKLLNSESEIKEILKGLQDDNNYLEKILSKEQMPGSSMIKKPRILPKTGTDLSDRTKIIKSSGVETGQTSWIQKSEGDIINDQDDKNYGDFNPEISHWVNKIPYQEDKDEELYIIIPSTSLVSPIITVDEEINKNDYQKLISGEEIEINNYLRNGALEYPGTSTNGYGEVGNKVIFGHSSYLKADNGRYKTIFQEIIKLDIGEEVWIYQKITDEELFQIQKLEILENSGKIDEEGKEKLKKLMNELYELNGEKYRRYSYSVEVSKEVNPSDTAILDPGLGSELTLFTCTPIGTIQSRWIIKAKYIEPNKEELEEKVYNTYLDYKYRSMVDKFIEKVENEILVNMEEDIQKIFILRLFTKINEIESVYENKLQDNPDDVKIITILNILKYLKIKIAMKYNS